jgi:hypothetical protein
MDSGPVQIRFFKFLITIVVVIDQKSKFFWEVWGIFKDLSSLNFERTQSKNTNKSFDFLKLF